MCSGRVDLKFVLRAFLNGADGVFIGGCHLGECNYVTNGNYDTLNMVLLCRKIMEHLGLNPERLYIKFMSAGDGILFSQVMSEFSRKVKELGPLGEGKNETIGKEALKPRLEEITKLVPYIKIVKKEKLAAHLENETEYATHFTAREIQSLLEEVVSYYIDPEKCMACMICAKKCPVDAINGKKNQIHVIDQAQCIKCGTCFEACPSKFGAVTKISGGSVPDPIPEEKRMIRKEKKND